MCYSIKDLLFRTLISVTPMVTVNCSSPITLDIREGYACECKGEGGNPPADVTWYKGNKQKGGTGKEEQILSLTNVDKNYSGTYTCEAKSHEQSKNETSIEFIVNCKYNCLIIFYLR